MSSIKVVAIERSNNTIDSIKVVEIERSNNTID
jgi:hypothetical protein